MEKVCFNVPTGHASGPAWTPICRVVSRVPNVGEYVYFYHADGGKDTNYYRVVSVVHCAFDSADCVAEVWVESKALPVAPVAFDDPAPPSVAPQAGSHPAT
jgi:hypothetical protein